MNNLRLKLYALFSILALMVPFVGAQPGNTFVPCLDTMAINSRYVFVARIVEIHKLVRDVADANVVVSVEQSLKGGQSDKLEVRIDAQESVLADWKDRGSRLLVFDGGSDPSSGLGGTKRPIDLSSSDLKILTEDMKVLTDPDEIIEAAQRTIASHRVAHGVYTIGTFARFLPPETAKSFDGAWSPYTIVPIDPALERWAQSVLRGGNTEHRLEAVSALQYFKSRQNIRLLTPLLTDASWSYLHRAEDNMGVEVRVYDVRQAAYHILRDWGADVSKPVIQEQTLKLDSVTRFELSNKKDFVGHADLDALSRFPNLQTLYLRNDHHMTPQAFRSLGTLKTLRSIDLSSSYVTDDRLTQLAALPSLQSLNLNGTKITDDGLKTISEFGALTNLDLTGTHVTWAGVAELRVRRPDLKIEFGK